MINFAKLNPTNYQNVLTKWLPGNLFHRYEYFDPHGNAEFMNSAICLWT